MRLGCFPHPAPALPRWLPLASLSSALEVHKLQSSGLPQRHELFGQAGRLNRATHKNGASSPPPHLKGSIISQTSLLKTGLPLVSYPVLCSHEHNTWNRPGRLPAFPQHHTRATLLRAHSGLCSTRWHPACSHSPCRRRKARGEARRADLGTVRTACLTVRSPADARAAHSCRGLPCAQEIPATVKRPVPSVRGSVDMSTVRLVHLCC